MTQPIISVRNLSKRYKLGGTLAHDTLRDKIAHGFKKFFSSSSKKPVPDEREFWALRHVSFDVQPGEVLGIIGRNGAGKSTLLKILSQITEPTSGEVHIHGRVASLLEVGTGFHPELSGRENIYLNGAILGMSKAEIRRKFDEIVAFAEIEKFLDTPVKRYSSGMYVRLAFAVAAHLEPEILIVDEVLAVGDYQFQQKCLGKMAEVSSKNHRTVLFVSHNMTAVRALCSRSILLTEGELTLDADPETAIRCYMDVLQNRKLEKTWADSSVAASAAGYHIEMRSVRLQPESDSLDDINVETPLLFETAFENLIPAHLNFSLLLYTSDEICVFNTFSQPQVYGIGIVKGSCIIPGNFLNNGNYYITLLIVKDEHTLILKLDRVIGFEVKDIPRTVAWHGRWEGVVRPALRWNTEVSNFSSNKPGRLSSSSVT